jgi:membrane protein
MRRFPAAAALVLRRAARSLMRERGTRDAAQVAFFIVMSFPAILLLLVWSFSAVLDDDSVRQSIVDLIVGALPLADPADRREIESLLEDVAAGAGSLGWIGAVALLYSASGAIGGLRYAVNRAWGEHDTRPFARGKALDVGLTLAVAPAMLVGLGLTLSGSLAAAIGDFPLVLAMVQFTVTKLVPIAVLLLILVALLRVLPATRIGWKAALLGALVALVGVGLVQLGAQASFSGISHKSAVYGTLGAVLGVVFSAYLDAIALVYGAHVAAQTSLLAPPGALERALEQEKQDNAQLRRRLFTTLGGWFGRVRSRR